MWPSNHFCTSVLALLCFPNKAKRVDYVSRRIEFQFCEDCKYKTVPLWFQTNHLFFTSRCLKTLVGQKYAVFGMSHKSDFRNYVKRLMVLQYWSILPLLQDPLRKRNNIFETGYHMTYDSLVCTCKCPFVLGYIYLIR